MSYKYETVIDDGKANRNGRVYSDELLAKYNDSCPKEIRYKGEVVGHMEHVCRDGEHLVAAMVLDKPISPVSMGIRGIGDVSDDGVVNEQSIESIDFIQARD